MEIVFIIYFVSSVILLLIGAHQDNNDIAFGVCFGIVIGLTVSLITAFAILSGKPQAIDVYRGKTTLEITYKDSVAIDSVVVFKK